MSAIVKKVDRFGLEVGQWIQFYTGNDLSEESPETKAIYQKDQRYLVITRDDTFMENCRCHMVNIAGELLDYCPRILLIEKAKLLPNIEIRVVSQNSVETIYGAEKIEAVYQAALEHIKKMSSFLKDYHIPFLGQSESSIAKAKSLRELTNPYGDVQEKYRDALETRVQTLLINSKDKETEGKSSDT